MKKLSAVLTAILCLCLTNPVHAGCEDRLNEISTDLGCTKIRTYKSVDVADAPILVVALHGDAPFNNPGYQYRFAKSVADRNSNVIGVGMLRPGYTDPLGRSSDGVRGDAVGDNYDETRVKQLARAIQALKKMYAPSKVVLAGHSGGAAITANIISLFPLLVDHAFLVSCPCDVNAWRENMLTLTDKSIFSGNINALSPIDLIGRVSGKTTISLLAGKNDRVAPPVLSETYKKAAEKRGLNVTLALAEGQHDIFLSPDILNAITDIISGYNGANAAGAGCL
ncbi:MAG: hypothetical protein MI892_07330 [Desulfobacterales bacterium]|nr:hypothetical protein [Desulfobacterales bacterium]